MSLQFARFIKLFLFLVSLFLSVTIFALDIVVDKTDIKKTPALTQKTDKVFAIDVVGLECGFSHNKFKKFNNDAKEIVINNVSAASSPKSDSAKVIIFEVTGDETSELKGIVRVDGEKAKLILVNPQGITCDGCSFVNVEEVEFRTDIIDAITENHINWRKGLKGNVAIGKSGVEVRDGTLAINARKIEIAGPVLAKESFKVEGGLIDIHVANPIIARNIYLIASGQNDSIRITTPKFFLNKKDRKLEALLTGEKDIHIETQGSVDIVGSVYAGDNLKIVGKKINVFDSSSAESLVELDKCCAEEGYPVVLKSAALNMPQIEAGKILELDSKEVHLDDGVRLKCRDQFLKLTAGNITGGGSLDSGGLVSVLSFGNMMLRDVRSQGNIALGARGDVRVATVDASQKGNVILQGKKIDVKSVSGVKNLALDGEVVLEGVKLNDVKSLEVTQGELPKDFIVDTPMEIKGDFKFKGRNFVNRSQFKADNVILDLSGDFVNDAHGAIEVIGKLTASSKSFSNYQKISIGQAFQIKSGYFVNDRGGSISAGPIAFYLSDVGPSGYSLYQGSDSVLESRVGGMELISPLGGVYFGYKKELTGAGDNHDGFRLIGSQLLNREGLIHIQAGGEVIFDGAQLLGDVRVEARKGIKCNDITGSYKNGTHPVTKREKRTRTVTKPVSKTRQVYWYTERWPKTVDIPFFGSPGGWGSKDHYRTETYVENVPVEESYEEDVTVQEEYFQSVLLKPTFTGNKQFFSDKPDLVFQTFQDRDWFKESTTDFLADLSKQHSGLVTGLVTPGSALTSQDIKTMF